MSDTTSNDTPTDQKPLGDPADKPPARHVPVEEHAEERKRRQAAESAAAALQKQLDEINAANLSDLERAQKAAADAQAAADKAQAEALRYRIAAKNSISDEDAELFLTGTDEETLARQAARLVERTPTSPRPDPSQGSKGDPASGSTADLFAQAVEGSFTR